MDSNLNQLAPITDFEKAYILAQQAHEMGFRGTSFPELYLWLKERLDLTGLSNTAGLPEEFPEPGSTLIASNPQEWTIIGPGNYNKLVSGTITIAEDEFGFTQFDGTDFNRVLKVKIPQPLVANQVVEGGSEATSQDAVFKNNIIVAVGNAGDPALIEAGQIDSGGNFTSTAGTKRIKNIPAFNGVPMTITGVRPSASKRVALYSAKDGAGWISNVGTVNLATITITPSGLPVNGGYLAFIIKSSAEADDATAFPALQVEYGSTATPYKGYDGKKKVIKTSQTEIEASYLKAGTKLGDKSIATEEFVNTNAIVNNDLEIQESINLANPDTRVLGSYIDSAGNVISGVAGWGMNWVDTSMLEVGEEINISNAVISTGHAAWYDGSTKVQYAGSYATGTLPVKFPKPAGGNRFGYTDMRSNLENPNIMVNLGASALPYEPYRERTISKIKNVKVGNGGGNVNSDQDLYKSSSVEFAEGAFGKIIALAMSLPLPVGDGVPPAGVLDGDGWIDSSDNGALRIKGDW